MQYQFRLHAGQYSKLRDHLFPGDGKEAVALLLCGRHEDNGYSILLCHEVLLIPHEECERDSNFIKWRTTRAIPFFERAEKHNFAIVKMHSHPSGYSKFSELDDKSDTAFFAAAFSWSETDAVHASVIMLPDGKLFGRVFTKDMFSVPIDRIAIAEDVITIWDQAGHKEIDKTDAEMALRTIQAFGEGTYRRLKTLRVGVVGCSGTGSPVVEQLYRLGVGELVLVDPDKIEMKNLNRILNSKRPDIGKSKVDVMDTAIKGVDIGARSIIHDKSLFASRDALNDLITCDVVFGCVDSVDGRNVLSRLTNFYLIPFFDLGIALKADGRGSVNTVVGSVNYLQPARSSLLSRRIYTPDQLQAESLRRTDPDQYDERLKQKYVQGVVVDRPAVISVNLLIAALSVVEFLNRLHSFKDDSADNYARVMVDFCGSSIANFGEHNYEQDRDAARWAGRGFCRPFLRMPELD